MAGDPQEAKEEYREFVELFVELWHKGLLDPDRTQAQTLEWLVEGYARTLYGQERGADALAQLIGVGHSLGRDS